jgi:hypothetical protein
VGAIEGNVNLRAGQTYTQRGSDVVAPGGDVNISAQKVTIEEAREMLLDIGFDKRPDPIKPIRLYKWSAPLFWALAV